jgi:leukotriene-A4 hydrolase
VFYFWNTNIIDHVEHRQKDASAFWLNEGWTTYFERVLQHAINGPSSRDFSYIIGAKALVDSLKSYKARPKYQRLVIDFDYGEVNHKHSG